MNKPKILKENVIALRNAWTKLSETWSENEDPIINQILEHDYPWGNCFSELRCDVVAWADTIEHKLGKLESDTDTQRLFEEFRKRKSIVPAKEAPQLYNDDECFWNDEPDGIRFCWTYDQLVIGIQNNGLYHLLIDRSEYQEESLLKLEKMLFDYAQMENLLEDLELAIKIESMLAEEGKEELKAIPKSSAYAEMFKDIRNWHRLWEAFDEKASLIQPLPANDFLNTLKDKYRVDFNTEFKGPKSVEHDREVLLIRTICFLWTLLDNIDTADDLATSNDKYFRNLVRTNQKRRWETGITTDGYTLNMTDLKEVDTSRDEKIKFK